MPRISIAVLVVALALVAGQSQAVHYMNKAVATPPREYRKQLAGPPSEFKVHEMPSPGSAALTSDHAVYPIAFKVQQGNADVAVWSVKVPVDSATAAGFTIFAPEKYALKLSLTDPSGATWDDSNLEKGGINKVVENSFGIGKSVFPSTTYYCTSPKTGMWTAKLSADAKKVPGFNTDTKGTHAFFMLFNETPDTAVSYISSYNHLAKGKTVGFRGHMANKANAAAGVAPLLDRVTDARMVIIQPDGKESTVTMKDDGSNGDELANDGIYSADFSASEQGVYRTIVEFTGTNGAGLPFYRTAEHSIPIVDNHDMSLVAAKATYKSKTRLNIDIMTTVKSSDIEAKNEDTTFRAYAQVWGTDKSTGQYVPVAWVQSMADVSASGAITLELDTAWLARAGATAPLELRAVSINNRQHFVPVAQAPRLAVQSTGLVEHLVSLAIAPDTITDEMRWGVPPPSFRQASNATLASGGKLLLVHGYCAQANNFPPSEFADNAVFEDFGQSRPTDVFARLVQKFGDQFPSFGTLAHSHGGLATLHLHTYYFSNLEKSTGNRRLQSMGSPYKGVPVAGLLASLGSVFGIGCGDNTDLTHDGAQLWLQGIPMEARKDMYYYTTQYKGGHLVNYCNIAANAVLKWPNDGVTETVDSELEGGNYVSHQEAWCHTVGMAWPQQCTDKAKNKVISDNAAR
eukprot:TRINITY_DN5210_c1_g2_i2.p1 TRINITY_DN5210_c1_g2~~TRINITY_DN5210_c1_g2_i2.p1  ORF type:complete len:686 (+),score=197.90 TRINITY_DN5210_c1_g2_i2:309-2366(+)